MGESFKTYVCSNKLSNYQGSNSCFKALSQLCSDPHVTNKDLMAASNTCKQLVWSNFRPVYNCQDDWPTSAIFTTAPLNIAQLTQDDLLCLSNGEALGAVYDPNIGECSPMDATAAQLYGYCVDIMLGLAPSSYWNG